jgi:hypothetical protein
MLNSDLRKIRLASDRMERNYCVRRGVPPVGLRYTNPLYYTLLRIHKQKQKFKSQ